MAIPDLGAHNYALLSLSPLSQSPHFTLFTKRAQSEGTDHARLACLIHAANVHSEPESNPSIGIYMNVDKPSELLRLTRLRYEPFETDLNG